MSLRVRRSLGITGSVLLTGVLALGSMATSEVGTAWTAKAPAVHADVVVARTGQVGAAEAAVRAVGGKVGLDLPLINGFAAKIPAGAALSLGRSTTVASITPDSGLTAASSSYDPTVPGASYPATSRASSVWAQGDRGAGTTVAVLDTGVSAVPDLAGRLINGIDLSGEGDSLHDSFGHGTVMAGIIAGDGSASDGAYPGIAPAARIVSVKVAGRNGATDVSTVLAGLQWIASHQAQYGINVVSLSWGSPSNQSSFVDPLDYAVEKLWSMGITVVVAAGNAGPGPQTISKPGDDPAVITVGAFADAGTVSASDDSALSWSGQGPTTDGVAKPDLVAPGRTLVAPDSPDSAVVADNPQALIAGGYIRGSGTSQATAVVAGSAALLLSAHPSLTPDQVKYALTSTAAPIAGVPTTSQGAGELRDSRALSANPANAPVQTLQATGLGSLEASRGGLHVSVICPGDSMPTEVVGEIDTTCQSFDAESWVAESWVAESWVAESWVAESWVAESWVAESWVAESWVTEGWDAASWDAPPKTLQQG